MKKKRWKKIRVSFYDFHPYLKFYKACIMPLSKQLSEQADAIYAQLAKSSSAVEYDEAGSSLKTLS